jgi:hypothetical protein
VCVSWYLWWTKARVEGKGLEEYENNKCCSPIMVDVFRNRPKSIIAGRPELGYTNVDLRHETCSEFI